MLNIRQAQECIKDEVWAKRSSFYSSRKVTPPFFELDQMAAREEELRTSMPFLYGLIYQQVLPSKNNREFLMAGSPRVDVWRDVPDEVLTPSTKKDDGVGDDIEEILEAEEACFNDEIGFEVAEDGPIAHNDRAHQVRSLHVL